MAERKEFYKQLKSFLRELIVVFPENDDDLLTITTSINLSMMDDDCDEIRIKFYNALKVAETEILARDSGIFNNACVFNWKKSTYEYELFDKLHRRGDTFTDNDKNVIWDYIILLYRLSKIIR